MKILQRLIITVFALFVVLTLQMAAQERNTRGRLFPPEDLGLLETPDRDAWQRPDEIMDALGIVNGAAVADVGAGGGWFTVRLARRVGPTGIVYAEDIQPRMIDAIELRVIREGLGNVRITLGTPGDPKLPVGALNAVLIVDTYHEIEDPVTLLLNVTQALKPNGLVGIVDYKTDGGGPGPPIEERVNPAVILSDAETAGLQLLRRENFLTYQYLLVLSK